MYLTQQASDSYFSYLEQDQSQFWWIQALLILDPGSTYFCAKEVWLSKILIHPINSLEQVQNMMSENMKLTIISPFNTSCKLTLYWCRLSFEFWFTFEIFGSLSSAIRLWLITERSGDFDLASCFNFVICLILLRHSIAHTLVISHFHWMLANKQNSQPQRLLSKVFSDTNFKWI